MARKSDVHVPPGSSDSAGATGGGAPGGMFVKRRLGPNSVLNRWPPGGNGVEAAAN
eukprot:CAMPEP_0169457884 /NCGR_PEP_ID=MMETSP1042-20121227/17119_1 /TAXON_ID=464988 /ORGANISM="Hemiselmis andersenii, Strain CCMP1180" /LENGTH=55 /DNA_ID=CAMNT_0009570193 /DNA_START=35 /DNA_END=202 /DNA_ORIENTATION=+